MKVIPLSIESLACAKSYMQNIGAAPYGIKIMAPKTLFFAFRVEDISSFGANIVKQHLLSLGSDAAISREALTQRIQTTIIIFGTRAQLLRLTQKLQNQPFGLKCLAQQLKDHIFKETSERLVFVARDKTLCFRQPVVCGIINVTPDSFSGDGIFSSVQGTKLHAAETFSAKEVVARAVKKAASMVRCGAKMIDIGGESSRPFADPISEKEEIQRVLPVITALRKKFPKVLLSIDTYKYNVARLAVEEGIDCINDITALRHSPQLASLIKRFRLGCVLMHMKGTPKTMQIKPHYKQVSDEVMAFLSQRLNFALSKGIVQENILLDPGIGFGKNVEDNLILLKHISAVKTSLRRPVFLGVSRKSYIGTITKAAHDNRLPGTIASIVWAALKGVDIFRVHDVEEVSQAIKVLLRIKNA